MCGTTWIEYACSHSEVQARPGSACAIGFANAAGAARNAGSGNGGSNTGPSVSGAPDANARSFCWEQAQGVTQAPGLCRACRFRTDKYGSPDAAVSLRALAWAGGRGGPRGSPGSSRCSSPASSVRAGSSGGGAWEA